MTLSGPITYYPSLESTQIEAKKSLTGIHWTTDQTAGKGRFDRQWYSEPDKSLAVSIALPEYRNWQRPYLIGMWVSLGIAELLDLRVQWPNDLVLNRKKVCGVLTEVIEGIPVIGFGINIGEMVFPEEIRRRASSLRNEGRVAGTPIQLFEQIIQMLNNLEPMPETWDDMSGKWRQFDETKGKIFKHQDGRVGIAEGVSEDAELIWNDHGHFEKVTCADALWGFNVDFQTI
jgi:BirA family biotin operon repressor/biotin-[acetyl-CoA-carboxylase] ligase